MEDTEGCVIIWWQSTFCTMEHIASTEFLWDTGKGCGKENYHRSYIVNREEVRTITPALIMPPKRAAYSTMSQLTIIITTSLSLPDLSGLTKWAIRWVAAANSANVMDSVSCSSDFEGNTTHGRSGRCWAWKSINPGMTVIVPSRGGIPCMMSWSIVLVQAKRWWHPVRAFSRCKVSPFHSLVSKDILALWCVRSGSRWEKRSRESGPYLLSDTKFICSLPVAWYRKCLLSKLYLPWRQPAVRDINITCVFQWSRKCPAVEKPNLKLGKRHRGYYRSRIGFRHVHKICGRNVCLNAFMQFATSTMLIARSCSREISESRKHLANSLFEYRSTNMPEAEKHHSSREMNTTRIKDIGWITLGHIRLEQPKYCYQDRLRFEYTD